jgi:hypothetical protein
LRIRCRKTDTWFYVPKYPAVEGEMDLMMVIAGTNFTRCL